MNQNHPKLSDLVNVMNGKSSTNLWDIVCSYTIDQLNDFLKYQYDAGKLAKEVKLSTKRHDDLYETDFTINYDIKFGSPVLKFISGRSGFATLTIPINDGSSYSLTPEENTQPTKTKSIPGGQYSVEAVVPLAAISGDTGEIVEPGKVIKFSDGKKEEKHVILHFKNTKGTSYQIVPTPNKDYKDSLVTYFLPVLINYFQTEVNEIEYALSTVNNQMPTEGLTVFTPKSFVFASMGDGEDGVLSLYIQTAESQNPQGNPSPSFQPGDVAMFPIPSGYAASIILSRSLITKTFLEKQLKESGFTVLFDTTSEGISAKLSKDGSVFADAKDGMHFLSQETYKGLNISLKDYPLTLEIKEGQLSLSWEGKTTSDWSHNTQYGGENIDRYGSVELTISLNKEPIKLALSNDDVTIADVNLSRSNFSIHTKAKPCGLFERGCMEVVPSYYSNDMSLTIPPLKISLHGFDFFRTTNLLAPGQHIIDVDRSIGVKTPHDFLIVGQVNKKPS